MKTNLLGWAFQEVDDWLSSSKMQMKVADVAIGVPLGIKAKSRDRKSVV
jgi:hypothetical protein